MYGLWYVVYTCESRCQKNPVHSFVLFWRTLAGTGAEPRQAYSGNVDMLWSKKFLDPELRNCPSCNERNFLKRNVCFKCQTPKPITAGLGHGSYVVPVVGKLLMAWWFLNIFKGGPNTFAYPFQIHLMAHQFCHVERQELRFQLFRCKSIRSTGNAVFKNPSQGRIWVPAVVVWILIDIDETELSWYKLITWMIQNPFDLQCCSVVSQTGPRWPDRSLQDAQSAWLNLNWH